MSKGTILLVDDEENVINSIRRSLRKEGYQILSCTNARQALELLQTEDVDLIISDQRMPGMSGMDFLIQAKKLRPHTIRILLTGYSDMEVAIKAINEGKLFRFLSKPWDDTELKVTILNAMKLRKILIENRNLMAQVQKQQDYIQSLEARYPGISQVKRDRTGAIILEDSE